MAGDFQLGTWTVYPQCNRLAGDGGDNIQVEPKAMQVLVVLADRYPEVVTKKQLLESVWPNVFVTDDVLKRSIFALRRAFKDDPKAPCIIETIPKSGYRLMA